MMSDSPKTPPTRERRSMTRARRNAEMQLEYAEKMHRLAMLRRRIELAQAGVRAYQLGKFTEAVHNFHSYIRILEDWKEVGEGRLMPSNFDKKADVAELLLISGVYWDLAKLYDRTKGVEKQREFRQYLEKYLLFSKGMSFQHVCLETLRKYISNEKPVHMIDFKNAYTAMGGTNCFVATALIDVCDVQTLPRLRSFRDERLSRSVPGRFFIRWYYRNGPHLAAATEYLPEPIRRSFGFVLDRLALITSRAAKR